MRARFPGRSTATIAPDCLQIKFMPDGYRTRSRLVAFSALVLLGRGIKWRYACLWCGRLGCRLRSWALTGWPAIALLYAVAGVLVWIHGFVAGAIPLHAFPQETRHDQFFRTLQWFFSGRSGPWVVAIALAALISAVLSARRIRKRIVILSFANLTGEDIRKALADSLPRRLMTELADVTDIYADVSDDPADLSLDHGSATPLTLAVDPATAAFSGLRASFKEPVRLGPLSIPVDGVLTVLSTLLHGPQVAGSIQKNSEGLLIEASISGGGFEKAWRVTESDVEAKRASGDSDEKITDEMIRHLACQVFTHLNQDKLGTQIWRAVQHYTEGLRAFRDASRERGRTTKRAISLQRAQQEFFRAHREDARFVRSRYNLGVIYFSQQQWQPAYEIFQKVINDSEGDPLPSTPGSPSFKRARRDLASAHYAAARAAVKLEKPESPGDRPDYHCDNAITLAPDQSGPLNLKGRRMRAINAAGARSYFRKAMALSWLRLCIAEWHGSSTTNILSQAITCMADLADADDGSGRSLGEMSQALYLDPSNAGNWTRLGKLCLAVDDKKRALAAFENANREQETGRHWLWVGCTRCLLEQEQLANEALSRATKGVAGEWLFEDRCQDKRKDKAHRVAEFWEEWDAPKLRAIRPEDFKQKADREIERIDREIETREKSIKKAFEDLAAFQKLGASPAAAGVTQNERENQIRWVEENYRTDIAARLSVSYAAKFRLRGWESPEDFKQAHSLVLKALDVRPLGARERNLFAELLFYFMLLERSENEVHNALSIEPDADIQLEFAQISQKVFETVTDKQVRSKAIRRIAEICRRFTATDGTEADDFRTDALGAAPWHYSLGMWSFELLDYQTAQKSFETCFARHHRPVESLQWLCLVYFRCGAFEEAERAYSRLNAVLQMEENIFLLTKNFEDVRPEEGLSGVPAFNWAMAANHTAAAMAEQGLIIAAAKRWKEGKDWGDKLVAPLNPEPNVEYLTDPKYKAYVKYLDGLKGREVQMDLQYKQYLANLKLILDAAQSLCRGAILLNAGKVGAAVPDPPPEEIPPKSYPGAAQVWHLEKAIELLTEAIAFAADTSIRADANYRIGLACEALARLNGEKSEVWRSRAEDALENAKKADRRDEYTDRIAELTKKLATSAR